MPTVQPFSPSEVERICAILADTSGGLSGSEIGRVLAQLGYRDPDPGMTKRKRLFNALAEQQNTAGSGVAVATFIEAAMEPVRYTHEPRAFHGRRDALNEILAFSGSVLGEDGKLRARSRSARTLSEAEEAAGRLKAELLRRRVHPDVLRFCRPELVDGNYFHAVFEATKSVADKIRTKAGVDGDGARLVDRVFSLGTQGMPLLALNSLQTITERDEQSGFMNLLKGVFSTFRNVTAHAPKINWAVSEQDALDLLTMASYLHRRLDESIRTPRPA